MREAGSGLRQLVMGSAMLACLGLGTAATADASNTRADGQTAEQWIVSELRQHHPAVFDLKANGFTDEDAVLSASFVSDLLTDDLPNVTVDRHGVTVIHATIGRRSGPPQGDSPTFDTVDLTNAEIPFAVELEDCVLGDLDASRALFKKTFRLIRTSAATLSFVGTQFQDDLVVNGSQVSGPLDLLSATLKGELVARESTFQGLVNLNQTQVKGGAYLEDSEFDGSLDAIALDTSYLAASRSHFSGTTSQPLAFDRMHVGSIAMFDSAHFWSDVSFSGAQVAGNLILSSGIFSSAAPSDSPSASTKISADLSSTKSTSGTLKLDNARFDGPAQFRLADVLNIVATKTQFNDEDSIVRFDDVKVAKDGDFTGANFAGGAFFTDSSFGGNIYFKNVDWSGQVNLSNMHYHDLFTNSDDNRTSNDWTDLKKLFSRADYWSQNYTDAEAYYKLLGRTDEANAAFADGKRLRRSRPINAQQVAPWTLDLLSDRVLCYGRCPERVLVPSAFFVLLGTVIFWRGVQPRKPDGTQTGYNPFWYSLDVFAPVISLHLHDAWVPNISWKRWYAYIQTLMGWVLVPIGLAAVTGLLK